MAELGIALFVIPRLLKTQLAGARYASLGAALWNAALIAGLGAIAAGFSDGLARPTPSERWRFARR